MRARINVAKEDPDEVPESRKERPVGPLSTATSAALDVASATGTVASAVIGRVGSFVSAAFGEQEHKSTQAERGRRRVKQACGPGFLLCSDDAEEEDAAGARFRPRSSAVPTGQRQRTESEHDEPGESLLARVSRPGGSLEDKLLSLGAEFLSSARRLEAMQAELRCRVGSGASAQSAAPFPREVLDVISEATYLDSFVNAFDGQCFHIHSETIVPGHDYCLSLEVHAGGAYWKGVATQEASTVRHRVATIGLSSVLSDATPTGSAQRGAVFVWRWARVPSHGSLDRLPPWLVRVLRAEGDDPVQKVNAELETLHRWQAQLTADTGDVVKRKAVDLQDPYIREVLRLWPVEPSVDAQSSVGSSQLKKRAWVEGLPPELFTGKSVLVHRANYDVEASHALVLKATITQAEAQKEGEAPYRLATTWHWASAPPPATGVARVPPLPIAAAQSDPRGTGSTGICAILDDVALECEKGGTTGPSSFMLGGGYSQSATSTERAAIAAQRGKTFDEGVSRRDGLDLSMPAASTAASGPEGEAMMEGLMTNSSRGTWRSAALEPTDGDTCGSSEQSVRQAERGTWRSALLEPVDDDGIANGTSLNGPGIGAITSVKAGAGAVRHTWRSALLEPEDLPPP